MLKNSVSKQEKNSGISRREFIKEASLVAGGIAMGSVVLLDACASSTTETVTTTKTSTVTTTTTAQPPSAEANTFLSLRESDTVKAIFGRLIPGDSQDPGAVEAGAHIYLDMALTGPYSSQQTSYRRGLAAVNAYSQSKYQKDFSALTYSQQDGILTDMQNGTATGFYAPTADAFLATLLQHVKEGTFCDPVYGGNQNLAGWKMIGFPGAQLAAGEPQLKIGADQSKITPILTLADMQSVSLPSPQNGY